MASHKQTRGGIRRGAIEGLPVVRRNVAGVDLGSERHWVCAPAADGDGREVADFGATTPELIRMAEWLQELQLVAVAMEGSGVYSIARVQTREVRGLETA